MLDAFADREDVGVRRLHVVVDDDAAVDLEAGLAARARRWAGCRRRRRRDRRRDSCRPTSATPSTWPLPRIAVVVRPSSTLNAELLHLADQIVAAVGIELPLHQRRHQVDDGDVAALHLQPARGLEAEQAAADDDRLDAGPRALDQRARVVERAEREDAVLVEPVDRRHPRRAAGGEQQRVVRRHAAVVAGHRLAFGIDVDDPRRRRADRCRAVRYHSSGLMRDVVGGLLAGEHRRQHDAVVVDVRLVAEDRDRRNAARA